MTNPVRRNVVFLSNGEPAPVDGDCRDCYSLLCLPLPSINDPFVVDCTQGAPYPLPTLHTTLRVVLTMKAIDIQGDTGPISSLFLNANFPKPVVGNDQVLVRVKAFGINPIDSQQRQGLFPLPPKARGPPMGVEFSGIIESAGPSITNPTHAFREGDENFGLVPGGAYSEYVVVGVYSLFRKPKTLSWDTCAAIPETWMTAVQALYVICGFSPGETVLWHAGASNVAIAGIQKASAGGARNVFVTASSDAKIQFCKEIGATNGYSCLSGNWAELILAETGGRGVDIIVDLVGGPFLEENLQVIAEDGRIVCIAALGDRFVKSANPECFNITPIILKRVRVEGSLLRNRDEAYQKMIRDLLIEHGLGKLEKGAFRVPIFKVLDWSNIQEAHRLVEQGSHVGKLICTVS